MRLLPCALIGSLVASMAYTSSAHAAASDCWQQRKHGHRSEAQICFERLTQSSDAYEQAEGYWGLEDWDRAKAKFILVAEPANAKPHYKVRWGTLLHERFNNKDAADLFHEALKIDPNNAEAYLGLATVSADGFDGKAVEYTEKAIELDPKLAAAHELMANLTLENDERKTALAEADRALALADDSLDAMAIHAAIELIDDHSPDAWFAKIKAVNPSYGEAYAHVAHHLELHYRYDDAAAYLRKAVETDPRLWSAHSALGIELMRLGKTEEPIRELQLSYDNGYRDDATVNSLRLLNSLKNFQTTRTSNTILVLHKSEDELMRPYLEAELQNILATYSRKYQMKLPGPVQVEMYPDHEDFAVRTMGMPGLGALGVTFDQVVAMDSPSARKPGDFSWGATLWHEMSHVFIINATHGRVPRWFTEGLAVHEEGERSPEWGNRVSPEVLAAIRDKKLLPVTDLDRGFVHPEYPSQVIVSYFQAGSICDFIKEKWNEGKLLDIVHSYAQLKPTPQVIQSDLGLAPEEFDKQYLAWLDKKYGAEAAHFDAWRTSLKVLVTASGTTQNDVAFAKALVDLITLYPEYVGDASAYELLGETYKAKGDTKAEADILAAYQHEGGEDPALLKRLAKLEEDAGRQADAIATLQRIIYIYPVKDEELHRHLGDLLFAQKQYDGAVREDLAALASNPVDKAGAQFHLAEAYMAKGQKDKAEESVLNSLEAAPGYRPAQKLLLELNQSKTPQEQNTTPGKIN